MSSGTRIARAATAGTKTDDGRTDGGVTLDRVLSLDAAADVARGRTRIALAPAALARCRASADRLSALIAGNRRIYGVTTGFGPLAGRTVAVQDTHLLQQKLVYHLASGVGPLLPWDAARAMVLARLMSIVQGASGASDTTIATMLALLNSDLAPAVPSQGTVGASGDLTPLAHMVLAFQGEGDFVDRHGRRIPGRAGLDALGLSPLTLEARDGLALVNGTSAMTGVAVLSAIDARASLDWAIAYFSQVSTEAITARTSIAMSSIPTSEIRTKASMTMPLSRILSTTSAMLVEARLFSIAIISVPSFSD